MRKILVFGLCAVLGALLMVAVSESNWPLAVLMGVSLGLSTALFVYVYPRDVAPPADRRFEKAMQRKAEKREPKTDFRATARY